MTMLIDGSVKKTLAKTAARQLAMLVGSALVARGLASPETITPLIGPATEILLGGLLGLVGVIGGLFSSKRRLAQTKLLAEIVPDAIARVV